MASSLLKDVLCESNRWLRAQSLAVPLPGRVAVRSWQGCSQHSCWVPLASLQRAGFLREREAVLRGVVEFHP